MNSIFLNSKFVFPLLFFFLFSNVSPAQVRKKAPSGTSAQEAPFWLDAEEYTSRSNQTAELKGKVKIIRGGDQLTCDHAIVNLATKTVTATGNVVYSTPDTLAKADKIHMNLETKKGELTNAVVQTGQVTFEGKKINKESENEYTSEDGSYTACTTCPPSWKFSSSKARVSIGKYAYFTSSLFRLYSVPFLWLPYLVVPVKSERQSGLLAPRFGWEDGHFHYENAFFWAIDQSHDATLAGHYYANRGYKAQAEYRYVLTDTSKGKFNFSYINDRAFAESKGISRARELRGDAPLPTGSQIPRWALRYDQHYDLPGKIANNISLRLVRDLQYPVDFPEEIEGRGDPALENRVSFAKNTENTHTSVETLFYQNLLLSDPLAGNERTVHKLPEFRYSIVEQNVSQTGLLFSSDVNYVNFSRPYFSFEDGNGNGVFDPPAERKENPAERELVRTGQRIIVEPKLKYPVKLGQYVDLVPSVTYSKTQYLFGFGDKTTASRDYARIEVASRTRFAKVFGDLGNSAATRFKHEIQPEVTYSVVPYFDRTSHTFFGPTESETLFVGRQPINEREEIQFDYWDRLADRHLLTYGITNKLIRKRVRQGNSEYREIIRHSLLQSYDINTVTQPPSGNVPLRPFSEITSLLNVRLEYLSAYSEVNYYPYFNTSTNSTRFDVSDSRGDALSIGYLNTFIIPRNQDTVTSRAEALSVGATLASKNFKLSGSLQYSLHNQRWEQYDTNLLIRLPGQCLGVLLTYQRTIGVDKPGFFVNLPIYFGDGKEVVVGKSGSTF